MSKAFSLMEVLIVIGVMAVLALITLPNLFGGARQTDLNNASQQIIATLREAQSNAVAQKAGSAWGVEFASATGTGIGTYSIFQGNPSNTQATYRLPATVSFTSSTVPSGSKVDITFSETSGAVSATSSIGLFVSSSPAISSTINIISSGDTTIGTPKQHYVYAGDATGNRVEKFTLTGTYVLQIGGCSSGQCPASSSTGQFNIALATAADTNGNLYVGDSNNHRIEKFDSNGNYLLQFGSAGSGDGQFDSRHVIPALAVDSSGNVYVSDPGNHRVEKFDSNGNYLMKFGSAGSGDGQFDGAEGIAIDGGGNIYITDIDDARIEKFDSNGNYLSQFGSYGSGNGQLGNPFGIAIDVSGNLYVADSVNYRVEKFDSNGNYLSQFGSYGAGNGQFSDPLEIAIDAGGNLYVTDGVRIEKFDSNGNYILQFGSNGSGDGQFTSTPIPIAVY